jgi:membrane-anchored protein YejM (alkaline phosphatase superfamily)
MQKNKNPDEQQAVLRLFFSATFIVVLLLCMRYFRQIDLSDPVTLVFILFALLTYGAVYLFPAVLITGLSHLLLRKVGGREESPSRWSTLVRYTIAVITTSAIMILLYADQVIFSLFGFHMNGFVWNLVITPGGIESMGGSDGATLTYALICAGFVVLQITLLALMHWLVTRYPTHWLRPRPRKLVYGLIFILVAGLMQSLIYGVSRLTYYHPVTNAARVFPLYQPLTMSSLAARLGYRYQGTQRDAPSLKVNKASGHLDYPLAPITITPPKKPLNIVWLVSESWRASMLDPEIMPATWAFSQKTKRFTQHYSGGNGTRMGMFSMFYGLYGPYWFQFLEQQRSPVIMDILQQQQYQMSMCTSAKFSYPEFDQTIFAKIPTASLHDKNSGATGWQNDRRNVSDMLGFIDKRDTALPFMTFMFFESPHARYYFPPEDAIRKPYLKEFNYANMSLERDIGLIYNRYVNSCHHLDSQFKRVFEYLETEGLLDTTIVVVTGDHGEEFMENGHWGHNSAFTEQQLRVPLLLWIPGMDPEEITRMTSHMDIIPTLLPLLGVESPATDYCLGNDLLSKTKRAYTVDTSWSQLSYIGKKFKVTFPFNNKALNTTQFFTKADEPIADTYLFRQSHKHVVVDIMQGLTKFQRK